MFASLQTRFVTCAPPPAVSHAVFEMWELEDEGRLHAGLPKPYVEIVVSLAGIHWWRPSVDAPEHLYADAWVTPIQSGPRYARAVGIRHLIGARIEPWAALALFGGLPPGDGSPLPRLAQAHGAEAEALVAALRGTADTGTRFALLGAWLEDQPALRGEQPDFGALATQARAGAVADALGLAPRTLRRTFSRTAGVSPKRWLRLHRLDAMLRKAGTAPGQSLADLAQELGYADQAHLTRDVAALTGATPAALQKRAPHLPLHLFPLS